ncbi:MAG: glycosyltransferase family 4 protein [Bacteroidales bacterium]|nr:glycosyltransferase family 4 protein [Bacteroidales bacterium]
MQDKKTKVLFIMQLYPPIHGASTVGEQIKNSSIINDNFDCTFIRISTKSIKGKNNILTQIVNYFILYFRILYALIREKYDSIYIAPCASGLAFYKDYFICLLAKCFCKRVIYHFHNKGIANNKHLNKYVLKSYFKNIHVILSSKYLKYDIEPYVKDENVTYIPYGITNKIAVYLRDKPISNTPVIIYFAHLMKEKGALILLEALKTIHEENIDFKCNFVGGSYDINVNHFKLLIEKYNLKEKVKYLEPKYNEEKDKVLLASDIFAFPTYYSGECFPLGLLEALKFGLPIITTPEGGIPDIVEDGITGFLVPQKDALSLAEKIEILIQNPSLRQQMGEAGRLKYEQEFTLNKFEERLKGILMEIIQ